MYACVYAYIPNYGLVEYRVGISATASTQQKTTETVSHAKMYKHHKLRQFHQPGKAHRDQQLPASRSLSIIASTDQWLAAGRQPGALNWALLWSFQTGDPIGTVNRATTQA